MWPGISWKCSHQVQLIEFVSTGSHFYLLVFISQVLITQNALFEEVLKLQHSFKTHVNTFLLLSNTGKECLHIAQMTEFYLEYPRIKNAVQTLRSRCDHPNVRSVHLYNDENKQNELMFQVKIYLLRPIVASIGALLI